MFRVLEADSGGAARVMDFTIFGLVLFSAVNLAVGNTGLEFFFISVFAAEYLIRLWCIVWHRNYRQGGLKSRLRYATTNAAAIIDFIAIWPTLVVMIIFGEVGVLPIFRLVLQRRIYDGTLAAGPFPSQMYVVQMSQQYLRHEAFPKQHVKPSLEY